MTYNFFFKNKGNSFYVSKSCRLPSSWFVARYYQTIGRIVEDHNSKEERFRHLIRHMMVYRIQGHRTSSMLVLTSKNTRRFASSLDNQLSYQAAYNNKRHNNDEKEYLAPTIRSAQQSYNMWLQTIIIFT